MYEYIEQSIQLPTLSYDAATVTEVFSHFSIVQILMTAATKIVQFTVFEISKVYTQESI